MSFGDESSVDHLFNVSKLQLATFVLAVFYTLLALWSAYKLVRIYSFTNEEHRSSRSNSDNVVEYHHQPLKKKSARSSGPPAIKKPHKVDSLLISNVKAPSNQNGQNRNHEKKESDDLISISPSSNGSPALTSSDSLNIGDGTPPNRFSRHLAQRLLYIITLSLLGTRGACFTILCVFSLFEQDVWYPVLVILFTLPEIFAISEYVILFFNWMEALIFSHDQYVLLSRYSFRVTWLRIYIVICFIIWTAITALYVWLVAAPDYADDIFRYLLYVSSGFCFGFCAVFGAIALYVGFCVVSGFPFVSSMARDVLKRLTMLFLLWTLGMTIRGIMDMVSLMDSFKENLSSTALSMFIIVQYSVAEFFPLLVMLDWSVISAFLFDDDRGSRSIQSPSLRWDERADEPAPTLAAAPAAEASAPAVDEKSPLPYPPPAIGQHGRSSSKTTGSVDVQRRKISDRSGSRRSDPSVPAMESGSLPNSLKAAGTPFNASLDVSQWEIGYAELALGPDKDHHNKKSSNAGSVSPGSSPENSSNSLQKALLPESTPASQPSSLASPQSSAPSFILPSALGNSLAFYTPYTASFHGRIVRVVTLPFAHASSSVLSELVQYLVDHSAVDHDHIAHFLGYSMCRDKENQKTISAVHEQLSAGSLHDVIVSRMQKLRAQILQRPNVILTSSCIFPPRSLLLILRTITSALQFLHSRDQVHSMLTSASILITAEAMQSLSAAPNSIAAGGPASSSSSSSVSASSDAISLPCIKVCDVGLRKLKEYSEVLSVRRQWSVWSAPEILQLKVNSNTKAADIYAFGVIALEALTGNIPFGALHARDSQYVYERIVKRKEWLRVPSRQEGNDMPDAISDLISSCLRTDPQQRPSIDTVASILDDLIQPI